MRLSVIAALLPVLCMLSAGSRIPSSDHKNSRTKRSILTPKNVHKFVENILPQFFATSESEEAKKKKSPIDGVVKSLKETLATSGKSDEDWVTFGKRVASYYLTGSKEFSKGKKLFDAKLADKLYEKSPQFLKDAIKAHLHGSVVPILEEKINGIVKTIQEKGAEPNPEGKQGIVFDPLVFGVNSLINLGWFAAFSAVALPNMGIDNLLYPDYDYDYDALDAEVEEELAAEYEDEEAAEEEEAALQAEEEGAVQAAAAAAGGNSPATEQSQNQFNGQQNPNQNQLNGQRNPNQNQFNGQRNPNQNQLNEQQNSNQNQFNGQQNPNQNQFNGQQNPNQNQFNGQQNPNQNQFNGQRNPDQNQLNGQRNPNQNQFNGQQNSNQNQFNGQRNPNQNQLNGQQNPNQNQFNGQRNPNQNQLNGQQNPNQNQFNGQRNPNQNQFNGQRNPNQNKLNGQQNPNQNQFNGQNPNQLHGQQDNQNQHAPPQPQSSYVHYPGQRMQLPSNFIPHPANKRVFHHKHRPNKHG